MYIIMAIRIQPLPRNSVNVSTRIALIGTKYCTPEINTSEIIVDFSGMIQRNFICQLYFRTDCHLSSGLLQELSNGRSVAFSNGFSLL